MRTGLVSPRIVRKLHRWLGLAAGVQVLAWSVGGLFFSLNPIAKVRGETEVAAAPHLVLPETPLASPSVAVAALVEQRPEARVRSVTLRPLVGRWVYEIAFDDGEAPHHALADASSGELRPTLSRAEAIALAEADFALDAPVRQAVLVEVAEGGHEYRGHDLPAWRVSFDHPLGTRIYVAAERGVVTARRNDRWRAFDFLWMLHVMDYRSRDDFNTWWLTAFAACGVVTVASGWVLWSLTTPLLRRRRVRA